MTEREHTILIAGAGGIGSAVALLFAEWADFGCRLIIGDAVESRAQQAAEWIRSGASRPVDVQAFALPLEGTSETFEQLLEQADILLDCLPGSQAPRMARQARKHRCHYSNLTEYVAETKEVEKIAEGAETGFLLQTGLAPGFVNVLGLNLFQEFCQRHGVDHVDSIRMRVGALSVHALPPHYYGFTWSPIGVATEYVKDAIVVRDGKRTFARSLEGLETVRHGRFVLEEALTSGGAADLPEALEGRVTTLDYKTLRHPGHYGWVKSILAEIGDEVNPAVELEQRMLATVPSVEKDHVIIYAAVEGPDHKGHRHRIEDFLVVEPVQVGSRALRAIQVTTAAGLAESARMLLEGNLKGVVHQSHVDTKAWLAGPFVKRGFYKASSIVM